MLQYFEILKKIEYLRMKGVLKGVLNMYEGRFGFHQVANASRLRVDESKIKSK